MASYKKKKSMSVGSVIAVIIITAIMTSLVLWALSQGAHPGSTDGNSSTHSDISSAITSTDSTSSTESGEASTDTSSTESTVEAPNGDIIFYEGIGYNLLSVVNKKYRMTDFTVQPSLTALTEEESGRTGREYKVDSRVAEHLAAFLQAGRENGHELIMYSDYRTNTKQNSLYESALNKYIDAHPGATREDAIAAVTDTAPPGTSEHCTGLAVDIYTWEAYNKWHELSPEFEAMPAAIWMKENAHKYGFIMRYPKDKEDITMISYEPWHFRYVGIEAATEIYNRGITLEEYTNKL